MKHDMICAYCGKKSDDVHRDHVVPRSRGGPDTASNIVIACADCNREKRDKLASEWLGDRCPEPILEIEVAVNARLKKKFAHRDFRQKNTEQSKLFAFHILQNGGVDFIGEIISEDEHRVRMEVVDAFMATGCGMWELSGQIEDCPRNECKIFNDRMVCLEYALQRNQRIYPSKKKVGKELPF